MKSIRARVDRLEAASLSTGDNQAQLSPDRWDDLRAVGEKAQAEWESRTTPQYRAERSRWYAIKAEPATEHPAPDEPVTRMDAGYYGRLREHLNRLEALAVERFNAEFGHTPAFAFG